MIYLDTSALVSIYVPEAVSDRIETIVTAEFDRAISNLSVVEVYSAISRRVRMKDVSRPHAHEILGSFEADMASGAFTVIALDSSHLRVARGLIARFDNALRTLDAIHMSVVKTAELELLTSDQLMARAARNLGIVVRTIRP